MLGIQAVVASSSFSYTTPVDSLSRLVPLRLVHQPPCTLGDTSVLKPFLAFCLLRTPSDFERLEYFRADAEPVRRREAPLCFSRVDYARDIIEGGCPRVPRAIRLFFVSWNVSHYLPLPGRPPPSAPKMAGIIPLVYDTIINVRSSGQIFFLSLSSPPLCFLLAVIKKLREKTVPSVRTLLLQILRSAYLVRKSLLLKQKYFFS